MYSMTRTHQGKEKVKRSIEKTTLNHQRPSYVREVLFSKKIKMTGQSFKCEIVTISSVFPDNYSELGVSILLNFDTGLLVQVEQKQL
jgi:hypothetical protein